jgi:hypothetical protein
MSLGDAVKIHIRRHLMYPMAGLPSASAAGNSLMISDFGFQFNSLYPAMEERMDTMSPGEEAVVTGKAYGAIALSGLVPTAGNQVTLVFTGGGLSAPETVVTTVVAGDTNLTFLARIVTAINQDLVLQAAGFSAVSPWSANIFQGANINFPEIAFLNPNPFTFTAASTGTTGIAVTGLGAQLDPRVTVNSNPLTIVGGYVPILNYLENAIGGATANADVAKAETFVHDAREIEKRIQLYEYWLQRLATMMGVRVWNPAGQRSGRCYL